MVFILVPFQDNVAEDQEEDVEMIEKRPRKQYLCLTQFYTPLSK